MAKLWSALLHFGVFLLSAGIISLLTGRIGEGIAEHLPGDDFWPLWLMLSVGGYHLALIGIGLLAAALVAIFAGGCSADDVL